MQLKTDDALFMVDSKFLGPKGYPFPWEARYSAYWVGATIFFILLIMIHRIGLPLSVVTVPWILFWTVVATTVLHKRISPERSAAAVLQTFWQEVTAERTEAGIRATLSMPRNLIQPIRHRRQHVGDLDNPTPPLTSNSEIPDDLVDVYA